MQLYLCNSVLGTIPENAKAQIAAKITEFSCRIVGAPPAFTHVFFLEDAPRQPLNGKSVFLFCNIHGPIPEFLNRALVDRMRKTIHKCAGVPLREIVVGMSEIPANCVLQGGRVPLTQDRRDDSRVSLS